VTIEDKLDRILVVIDELKMEQQAYAAELDKLRAAMSPKLLDRAAIAKLLGKTPNNLRMALSRGARGKSPLGEMLLRLAVVGLDGRQAWRPSDIEAHCRPWLGREDQAGDGANDD
jgi:hypothetical protein